MASIIVALDLPSAEASLSLVDRLGDSVTWYKLGPPLYTRAGATVIEALKKRGKKVFLDLKFHDIPNTVALAVEAATEVGVDMLSVHTLGGTTMLRAARQAVVEDGPLIVGITLLTSFTPADVEQVWGKELFSLREEVSRLAALASETALNGVVTSVLEAEALKRRHGADFVVVTPGIRSPGEDTGDQIRTATPAEAVRAGSDYLVVGRPVLEATDPVAAVERILDEMQGAVGGMKRRTLALVAFAMLVAASNVRGQQLAPIIDSNASGAQLGQVLTRLAVLWGRGDASAIASFAASAGVSINVDGNPISPLSARQVAAALRHMFEQQETVALRSGVAQIVGGAPARAFGEMTWSVRARGTTIPEHTTVFVALVWEGDAWRVNQIRVIK